MQASEAISTTAARRSWRLFGQRAATRIDEQYRAGANPHCPTCETVLIARPSVRLCAPLPLDAVACDLECGHCRRYHRLVHHTERSLRLLRMRRLAAAVRAVHCVGAAA